MPTELAYKTAEAPLSGVEGEDLFPVDEEAQKELVNKVAKKFKAADRAKQGYQEKWDTLYKMYRSFVKKKASGDWRSRIYIPISFFVIETVTPRLVAQLPNFKVEPVSEDDVLPARLMEELLKWSQAQTDLYLELVKATKSALLYGTGILKTFYDVKTRYSIVREPMMQESYSQMPMRDVDGMPRFDVDGMPLMQQVRTGLEPVLDPTTGQQATQVMRRPYQSYSGPSAEAVDIDDFFVDPQADSIDSARYVIHRVFRDKEHLEQMFAAGVYKKPPEDVWHSFLEQSAASRRTTMVDLGGGPTPAEDEMYSVLEYWTDDELIVCIGDGKSVTSLLRYEKNPYGHGEKPFVRIVDYLVPHEFWGIGELEPLQGLQEGINSLWNSRIDNVKIALNMVLTAVMDYVVNPDDLVIKPGQVIQLREGIRRDDAVGKLELGDITSSSYKETAELERIADATANTSAIVTGQESPSYARTASGLALTQEISNTRFSHKVKMAELTGFQHLARQFGENLKQFMPDQMKIRVLGEMGGYAFAQISPEQVMGAFDYSIEAESSTQTESVRKEQAQNLFSLLAMDPLVDPFWIRTQFLRQMGVKDPEAHVMNPAMMQPPALPPGEEGPPPEEGA